MTRIALALLALVLIAAPAAAQNTVKWGAIAYGGPDRKTAAAVDRPGPGEALEAARENCGGICPRTIVFYAVCAVVAQNESGGLGWATSRWRGRAQARAMITCQRNGPGCAVTAWACTVH